jgi:trans-2,3-dihydro-3-hydroxyanthranilate isomerase
MPRVFPFMLVDAFTDRPLSGNACAIVFDADELDTETMQAVAREMNLSETSFVLRPTDPQRADFRARYFTPGEEIPLAGHPTIATGYALVDSGRLKLEPTRDRTTIALELNVGPIRVDIVHAASGRSGVAEVGMFQRTPEFRATYPPEVAAPVFGLTPTDLVPGVPVQTVSTGTPQLMLAAKSHEVLRRAQLDVAAYDRLRRESQNEFFSAHVFALGGVTPRGNVFARHFTGPPASFEDPFTGSATGGMGAFLWHYGLLDSPRFTAEQGHWLGRPGAASVEVMGPRDAIETVRVAGPAVAVVRGELTL